MRWISHTMISASLCAVWQPALMPAAVLGATAPDWLEWLGRRHLPLAHAVHRGRTHNLLAWLLLLVLGDRKSTRLNSSHSQQSRMPSSA